MQLTAAKPRRHRLTALSFDDASCVSVDTETFLLAGWKPGREVSEEELSDLIDESNRRRAQEKALYLLEYRGHSKRELEEKIARTLPREAAKAAADRMEELGLLDDAAFGKDYAKALYRKGYARRHVVFALKQKGIGEALAAEIAEDAAPDPVETACGILRKKYPQISEEKTRRHAFSALQRMGYDIEEIRAAIGRVLEDLEEG